MSFNYEEKYKDLLFNFQEEEEEKEIDIMCENLNTLKIDFEKKSEYLLNFLNEQFDLKKVRKQINKFQIYLNLISLTLKKK